MTGAGERHPRQTPGGRINRSEMPQIVFQKATKKQAFLRAALIGPSGSGKTLTALKIAEGLGDRIALIDTERGSASKYAGEPDVPDFDTLQLCAYHPRNYVEAIHAAEGAGYQVLIIDSLSHAWNGPGGALELVDQIAKRSQSGNSFSGWREVTPLHNALVDAILSAKLHVIATMRAKTEYVQERDERGRTVIRKVGLAPVQRDGMEYEFDLVGDLTLDHDLIVSKTRCRTLDGAVVKMPGRDVAATLKGWLSDGAPNAPRPAAPPLAAQTPSETIPASGGTMPAKHGTAAGPRADVQASVSMPVNGKTPKAQAQGCTCSDRAYHHPNNPACALNTAAATN